MLRQTYADGQEILAAVRRMNPTLTQKQFTRLAPHGRYGDYVQLVAKKSGIDAQIIEMYAPQIGTLQFRQAIGTAPIPTGKAGMTTVSKHVRRIQTFVSAGQVFGVDIDWLVGEPPPNLGRRATRMLDLAKAWINDPDRDTPEQTRVPAGAASAASAAGGRVPGPQGMASIQPGDKDVPVGFVSPMNTPLPGGSQFMVGDPEGADGYHGAVDWFAPGGTSVASPIDGVIVEVSPSQGNSGQIFGGVVKVQGPDGRVWVFRHVDPGNVRVGQRIGAGTRIASVTSWADGSSHTHVELWRTLAGGYHIANMIDPLDVLRQAGR